MLSKNKIKFINSIKKKKYREIYHCFFVEGEKMVDELLHSEIEITEIFATPAWLEQNKQVDRIKKQIDINETTEGELKKISALSTPNKVLAIAKQPSYTYTLNTIESELSLFLDNINDPGNLGTILRIADWFGIKHIFCSQESVDLYNPKVVQSTMGAIFRVKVHYVNAKEFLTEANKLKDYKIYGTFLEGGNIYNEQLSKWGLVIMGSESHGIADEIKPYVHKKLFIPNYPPDRKTSESLNISVATSIICSEFRRRM
ncbi:MAG: RNA methyltransferase [Bacteroidetes bacterium]|nr:RNA methyltransferase [Bacteroidota bacterium]